MISRWGYILLSWVMLPKCYLPVIILQTNTKKFRKSFLKKENIFSMQPNQNCVFIFLVIPRLNVNKCTHPSDKKVRLIIHFKIQSNFIITIFKRLSMLVHLNGVGNIVRNYEGQN